MSGKKAFTISQWTVLEAWKRIKANKGAAGIDDVSIEQYEQNLKMNLYKLWNRMSSGSYFPKAVLGVEIPKKSGGKRLLGIPTVEDRIAQMVVRMLFEPQVEAIFHDNSYGYRPKRSAIDAVGLTRKRCWKYDWVIELDIKGLFDNIDHELLMQVVRKHANEKWEVLYIERWLTASILLPNGELKERMKGTPQGGVISPVLANLFMHYAFDSWMEMRFPHLPWVRYADDGVIHCRTEQEAQEVIKRLNARMQTCKLEPHPTKTRIVYCKDKERMGNYPNIEFDFLGYTFRGQWIKDRLGRLQCNFIASVSRQAIKAMRDTIRSWGIKRQSGSKIRQLSERYNAVLRGWFNYYGRYCGSAMKVIANYFNECLVRWAKFSYRSLRQSKLKAWEWLRMVARRTPKLFVHWEKGYMP